MSVRIFSPKKLKMSTEVMSPATVIAIISKLLMPAAGPSKGGNIDFRHASK